jgi:tetratricopeptide (TPR) repeat protein
MQHQPQNGAIDHCKQTIDQEAVEQLEQTTAILQRTERECTASALFAASSLAAATNEGADNDDDDDDKVAATPHRPACAKIANRGRQGEECLGQHAARGNETVHFLSSDCSLVHSLSVTFRMVERQLRHAFAASERALGPDNTTMLAKADTPAKLIAAEGYIQQAWTRHAPKLMKSDGDRRAPTEGNRLAFLTEHERLLESKHKPPLDSNSAPVLESDADQKRAAVDKFNMRALELHASSLCPRLVHSPDCLHYVGLLYLNDRRLAAADKTLHRALLAKERTFGPNDVSTLLTASSLGDVCRHVGKFAEAEQLYRRAQRGFDAALGPRHRYTLHNAAALGTLLADLGWRAEAGALLWQVLPGFTAMFGRDHEDTRRVAVTLEQLHLWRKIAQRWLVRALHRLALRLELWAEALERSAGSRA